MSKERLLYGTMAALFVTGFLVVFHGQAGKLPTAIIGGAMIISYIIWMTTGPENPPEPRSVLPAYLLTGAFLMVHVWEEYAFAFGPRIAALSGGTWSEHQFISSIVFFGPVIWILGAIGIAKRHPLGGYMAWFLFIAMVFAEPTHFIFPLLEGGRYHYFPGLWTALLPLVPACWGLVRLIQGLRHAEDAA